MPGNIAISAFHTYLKVGDGASPEVFTTIAEVQSLKGPSFKADTIDVTSHNTATPWRSFISGLIDGGEVQIGINYVPTNPTHDNTDGVLNLLTSRTESNWKIVFPDVDETEWIFPGIVVGFDMEADPAAQLKAMVTIKVSGPPTLV